jgi:Ni/Co efflux regulator RcnB
MLAGPLAATASAQDFGRDRSENDGGRGDRDGDRRGDRGDRNDNDRDGRWNRDEDRSERRGERNGRQHQRWDRQRHNGYSYNGRWNYGPPPTGYEGRNGYEVGYRSWRRGDRLPSYYRSRYRTVDYRREHLRAPPRGYHYVEDDRGDMLLVGIATGVILSIILSQ